MRADPLRGGAVPGQEHAATPPVGGASWVLRFAPLFAFRCARRLVSCPGNWADGRLVRRGLLLGRCVAAGDLNQAENVVLVIRVDQRPVASPRSSAGQNGVLERDQFTAPSPIPCARDRRSRLDGGPACVGHSFPGGACLAIVPQHVDRHGLGWVVGGKSVVQF